MGETVDWSIQFKDWCVNGLLVDTSGRNDETVAEHFSGTWGLVIRV